MLHNTIDKDGSRRIVSSGRLNTIICRGGLLALCARLSWWLLTLFFFTIGSSVSSAAQATGISRVRDTTASYHLVRHQWNSRDGVPDWTVYCYFQDSDGVMWMASQTGLFTFDGLSFQKINLPPRYFYSVHITRLAEDKKGNIWIFKSNRGYMTIDVYNPCSEEILALEDYLSGEEVVKIPSPVFPFIFYNIEGEIWMGSPQVGYHFNGKANRLFEHKQPKAEAEIWAPAPGRGRWLIAEQEIKLVDSRSQIVHRFKPEKPYVVRSHWIDKYRHLWIAYARVGSTVIDHYGRLSIEAGRLIVHRQKQLPWTGWFSSVQVIGDFSPFIAHGFQFENRGDDLYLSSPQSGKAFNLSELHPDISSIGIVYVDREGGIWGSNSNGISRFVIERKLPFVNYLSDFNPTYIMRGLHADNNYLLALGSQGVQKVDLQSKSYQNISFPQNDAVVCLQQHHQHLIIGFHGGNIAYLNPENTNIITQFRAIYNVNHHITTFHTTTSGIQLAGTEFGLYTLDSARQQLHLLALSPHKIFDIHENQQGLWIGTANGLYNLSLTGKVKGYYFSPAGKYAMERIEHIHEDPNGTFWLATRGAGLIIWNPGTGHVQQFDMTAGLSNNNIHAVYPDGLGYMWLPSDEGLMRFHISSKRVQTYFRKDGLPSDEFNTFSHQRGPDGRLYFGGMNGVTSFFPDEITEPHKGDKTLRIINTRTFAIKTGQYTSQSYHGCSLSGIVIHPEDTYVDLSVSPLLFEQNIRLVYTWKIEGIHSDWVHQTSPVIRLSNLPYGNNNLLIKYHQKGNSWQGKPLKIQVTVLRPYYLRFPFISLMVVLFFGLVYLFSYLRNRQLRANNLQLEEEVAKRTHQIENNLAIIESDRQTISRQAQELLSLDKMKSRFFANVTHELRTPLTLILGPIDRILHGQAEETTSKDYLRNIQRNALRLLNLVEELLDLSKMETQSLQLEEAPVALRPLLERLVSNFKPYARHRRIQLHFDYQCMDELVLMLDQRKWEKIINNLLGNAFKYTVSGGNIRLSVCPAGDQLLLQIADDGHGIHPEDLPNIFDRYYQSAIHRSTLQGGTGIGLSLCKEYIRQFGGEISVESSLGKGSTFSLLFPAKMASNLAAAAESSVHFTQNAPEIPALIFAENVKKYNLLLVEDDLDMLNYLCSILSDEFNLLIADNGERALELLNQQPVDLILSDLMMPAMDGLQLLQIVKNKFFDLPFILLTAKVESQDRLEALRLGVDDYLTKPFIEEELSARLNNLLNRYEIRRALRTEAAQQHSENPVVEPVISHDQKWLKDVETIVNDQLADVHFSVHALAEKLNITERTLQNKLKACTGMTPNQYLTELRLIRAKQLLEERTFETVMQVCFAVGFKTPWYFARLMKERFGKHPSDF